MHFSYFCQSIVKYVRRGDGRMGIPKLVFHTEICFVGANGASSIYGVGGWWW